MNIIESDYINNNDQDHQMPEHVKEVESVQALKSVYGQKGVVLIPVLLVLLFTVGYATFSTKYLHPSIKSSILYEINSTKAEDSIRQLGSVQNTAIVKTNADAKETLAHKFKGQLNWGFASVVNIIVCFGILLAAYLLITVAPVSQKDVVPFTVTIGIVSLAIGLTLYWQADSFLYFLKDIIAESISNKKWGNSNPDVFNIVSLLNSFTYAAAIALILSSYVLVWPINDNLYPISELQALKLTLNTIANQLDYLRFFLYCGTIILIISVVHQNTLLNWSYSFLTPVTDDDKILDAQLVGDTLVWTVGAFHTILLAIVYLPSAYILEQKAKFILKTSTIPDLKLDELFEKKSPSNFFTETLPRVVAVLGPFLTTSVAELVKAFTVE